MSKYTNRALLWLKEHQIELRVKESSHNECPPFCDGRHIHGRKYNITIVREGKKNLTFPFWNSLNDSQKGESPTAYDVLSCVQSDAGCPNTFEDFCGEFGYDQDSRKAKQLFDRCYAFAEKANAFFDEEELASISTFND